MVSIPCVIDKHFTTFNPQNTQYSSLYTYIYMYIYLFNYLFINLLHAAEFFLRSYPVLS